MWPNSQETADLVTFTEEILNGKLHFLCSVEERKRKPKNEKNPNNNKKYYFTFPFLYGKLYILLGNILGKT